MTSAVKNFTTRLMGDSKQLVKLFKKTSPGKRLVPTQTSKNDADWQCRIDLGEELKDRQGWYNVYLQVNSQATSKGLKDWLKKNPHGNLATAQINRTVSEDKRLDECKRVVNDLADKANENL